MIKYFVLDTNVLIHNPNSIYSFSDNTVVIPITVIEELDSLKSISDKKGMHARAVLREIDNLVRKGALSKGANIKSGGTLQILYNNPETQIKDLNLEVNDNKILMTALELQKKGKTVFFISKDLNARIKAEALGIKARDYEKEKVEYGSLYKGWKEILLKSDEINSFYKENHYTLNNHHFIENEYALIKAENGGTSTALAKYDSQNNQLIRFNDQIHIFGVKALNMEQRFAMDLLLNDQIKLVTLVGPAGTGKTLLAIACGLFKTIAPTPTFDKMLVARPIIPMGKDIGYLPGSKDQKLSYWMRPIFDNLEYILKNEKLGNITSEVLKTPKDRIDYLLKNDLIEIEALTYIRGRSIPQQFIIVDEAQNLTPHEIKTIISRAGKDTKIVLTGDPEQIDNAYLDANSNGLSYTVERLKNNKLVGHVYLSKGERSELANIAMEKL